MTQHPGTNDLRNPHEATAEFERPSSFGLRHAFAHWVFRYSSFVNGTHLALFRIVFGLLLFKQALSWCLGFDAAKVRYHWTELPFHFSYPGFSWVPPWPGDGMLVAFILLALLALLLAAGCFYRVSAWLTFLVYTHIFLVERLLYQNHLYLVLVLCFLLALLPAHSRLSVDARRGQAPPCPRWSYTLLRFQFGLVYFYAGLAKCKWDWLRGEPIRSWLTKFGWPTQVEALPYFISHGALLFDLTIPFFLLWRRTRPYAIAAALLFHLTNATLFDIGIFPWVMIAGTLLFLEPRNVKETTPARPPRAPALALVGLYAALQVALPLRHFLYPGNVCWTGEAVDFAWHMKLFLKEGLARFYVTPPGRTQPLPVDPGTYLRAWQVQRMAKSPEAIRQFAHFLAERYADDAGHPARVQVGAMASLNGREPELLVDPGVDLGAEPWRWGHAAWIRPLTMPLPARNP